MNFIAPDLTPALPELFVTLMACAVLLVDVYLRPEQRHITYRLTQLTLLGAAALTLLYYAPEPVIAFHGHYVKDTFGDILKLGVYLAVATVFLYSRDYQRERGLYTGEYYVLGLLGVLGTMVMISANSFLTLYLGLELLSLCMYAMIALDRDSPVSTEAAMKFFVLGALSSGMLLYGISMIYGATASLDLQTVTTAVMALSLQKPSDLVLVFGLVFLVTGIGFKFGAVPFHMWLPDVYQGAPTSVTLYIAAAPKLAAFALAMRILVGGLSPLTADWQQMLIVLAVLSIGLGNIVAVVQTNLKRLLAYSSISHIGFILLGILAGTQQGYSAALFYALTYVLMSVGSFGMILALSRAGFESDRIDDFKGLNDRNPWLAFLMLLIMMSLAGVPFLVGFYSKLVVLQAIIDQGMVWLAVYSVVLSVIGAFYYLRVVKVIYFDAPERAEPVNPPLDANVALSANGLLILLLGLYPTALMTWCASAF